MAPKEKAEQLYDKFHVWDTMDHSEVKKMTLIAVDEILSVVWYVPVDIEYWQEVKQEIEKL